MLDYYANSGDSIKITNMTSGSAANFNFTSSSPQINYNRDRTKMEKRASPETK